MIYISIYLYFSFTNISAQLFISGVSNFPLTHTYNQRKNKIKKKKVKTKNLVFRLNSILKFCV